MLRLGSIQEFLGLHKFDKNKLRNCSEIKRNGELHNQYALHCKCLQQFIGVYRDFGVQGFQNYRGYM